MLAITRSLSLGVKIGKLNGNVNPDDLKAQSVLNKMSQHTNKQILSI
jgi:hypothetical protein